MKKSARISIFFLSILLSVNLYPQWYSIHSDQQKDLKTIKFISEELGFVAGDEIFARTTDGGRYWATLSNMYGDDILSIDFINETEGIAVGRRYYLGPGFIRYTSNGGHNWNSAFNDFTAGVNDVFLFDDSHGWAVGEGGNIFKATTGISYWSYVASGPTDLFSVFFINQNIGWTVGWNGTLLKSTDSGNTWFSLDTNTSEKLNDVFFIDEDTGWIVTWSDKILKTTDGGNTWLVIHTGSDLLARVQFINHDLGYVSGNSKVLKTTDGGFTWLQKNISASWFEGMYFLNDSLGFIASWYDFMFKTTNGGETWDDMMLGEYNDLQSLRFLNEQRGIAVGDDGTILRTTNGGGTWFSARSNTYTNFKSVEIISPLWAIAVGENGKIFRSYNEYYNWTEENSGTTENLNSVCFVDEEYGWIVGDNGLILRSTNTGKDWVLQGSGTIQNLKSVFFISKFIGWAVGDWGTILKTTSSGDEWMPMQSGTNTRLLQVIFIDQNMGYALGLGGTTYKSFDGGESWVLISDDQYEYYSMSFVNHLRGWKCGEWEKIKRTVDGGLNWGQQFSSSSSGSLKSIQCLNDDLGFAVGKKGRIIRTINGGDPIPVEFVSFFGHQEKGKVYLEWKTATETNNMLFEIQRKINNGEWITIGYQEGAGTTTKPKSYEYIDDCWSVENGFLTYRLKQVDFNGTYEYSTEILIGNLATDNYQLFQNFPNPFNPNTTIRFSIPVQTQVILTVFNSLGEQIDILVSKQMDAGMYQIQWNAENLPSGIYFYKLIAGDFAESRKLILLK